MERLALELGLGTVAVAFLWLYIDAKSDIKAEIERCNLEKMAAVAEAQRVVRYAELEALNERIAELRNMAEEADRARLIAEEAAEQARNKPEKVRTVIREVASANACIDTAVPAAVLDSMRQ